MKNFICVLCSLSILITAITWCNQSLDNPFIANNAIKGQIGELYYAVPNNAVLNKDSSDNSAMYIIPINNSAEEYTLMISYAHTDNKEEYESILQHIDEMKNQTETENGTIYTTEDINVFLGRTIDKGCKCVGENNGQKSVVIIVAESGNMYMISYTVKTGFYDQSVWDNFYAQLELV